MTQPEQDSTPEDESQAMAALRVRGLVTSEDGSRVLLVRDLDEDDSWWVPPGGRVKPGERPVAACAREIAEEAGVTAKPVTLAVVAWEPPRDGPKSRPERTTLIFDCGRLDPAANHPATTDGHHAIQWVPWRNALVGMREDVAWMLRTRLSDVALPPAVVYLEGGPSSRDRQQSGTAA